MSLSQMQSALALLVRYPESFDGAGLSDLLDQYDLSEKERKSLSQLASDRELRKFGHGIQEMRWSLIDVRVPLLKRCVPQETLLELFSQEFEPGASLIQNRDLALEFLSFLETDANARSVIERCGKDYVWDFLTFEKTQLEILRDHWHGTELPDARSPLTTQALYLRELAHDLPRYLPALENAIWEGTAQPEPIRKPTLTLFTHSDGELGYRFFELEAETYYFLRGALEGETSQPLPSSYQALVEAGLCKPIGESQYES